MAEFTLTFERGVPIRGFEDYLERHARSLVSPAPVLSNLTERPYELLAGQPAAVVTHEMSIVPKRILLSGDRTIVFWADGTKTIVKRAADEPDNDYAAFTAALGIKLFGSNSALKRMIERKTVQQKPKCSNK